MAIKRIRAPKTRNKLAELVGSLPRSGMTTSQIISEFKSEHGDIVQSERQELLDIGISRVLMQIAMRHSNATVNFAPDLFGKYGIQPMIYVSTDTSNGVERVLKNVADITLIEAERVISEFRKPRKELSHPARELIKLVADFKKSSPAPTETIGRWWQRKREGGPK
jgi:hypothetical protein